MDINMKLNEMAQEIIDEENEDVYSEYIQMKLSDFYLQQSSANSYDDDCQFYGEVM